MSLALFLNCYFDSHLFPKSPSQFRLTTLHTAVCQFYLGKYIITFLTSWGSLLSIYYVHFESRNVANDTAPKNGSGPSGASHFEFFDKLNDENKLMIYHHKVTDDTEDQVLVHLQICP